MSGEKLLLMGTILMLILTSCAPPKNELIIQTSDPAPLAETKKEQSRPLDQSKPLITLTEEDTALILVRQDGAPGMYLGEDGEVHGFYVDLEKMVMARMGQHFKFIPYSDVGPMVQGIKSGIYHMALAAPDVVDYRSFLNLSIPYEILHYVTFVQSSNKEITGSTAQEMIKSLHGKRVGVQTRGHIYQALRDIREIELIEYPTTTQALADLNKGLLDGVPDVKRIGLYYAAKEGWDIEPRGEAIINHKVTTAFSQMVETSLLERYNRALQDLIADGSVESLYIRYYGKMEAADKPWLIP